MKIRAIVLATTALIGLSGAAQAATELYIINCGADTEPQNPVQAKDIDAWVAENPDYTVRVEFLPWEQCQEKTMTLAAAGTPPAAAYMGSRTLKQLASSDQIVPIELSADELKTYEPAVISTVQFDGKVWGLPRAFSTQGLYYNKDLFQQAGIDMPEGPKTFEDVLTAAKAVTDKTDAAGFGIPAADMDNTFHEFLPFLFANGGHVVDAEGKVDFNTPNNVETLKFYQDLAKFAQEGPIAYDRGKIEPLFKEGQVAMFLSGAYSLSKFEGVNYGTALIPVGPSGKPSTLLITDSLVVFKGTGVEEPTTSLIKYLTAPERQAPFDEAGGWTPIRPADSSAALVAKNPNWKPFLDSIPTGGPEPLMTDYIAMQDVAIEGIQGIVTDELTPEEAAEQINDGLAELN